VVLDLVVQAAQCHVGTLDTCLSGVRWPQRHPEDCCPETVSWPRLILGARSFGLLNGRIGLG
jgi:hypothetical protein